MFVLCVLLHVALWCAGAAPEHIQDLIRHDDYCPFHGCVNDTQHFICQYTSLQPEQLQAQCARHRRIHLNSTHVDTILRITNRLRSRCALGRCRGYADNRKQKNLPRGYGIIRLRWDSELAGLAQVMADRCIKFYDHKHCVASRKFRSPREVYFLIHERVLETKQPVNRSAEELLHEFRDKIKISEHDTYLQQVLNVPNLNVQLSEWDTRFISLVYYKATHIGCGAAQYNDPDGAYPQSGANYVDSHSYLRCFVSHSPELGMPLYSMRSERGECGCEPGVPEERDTCLCVSDVEPKQTTTNPTTEKITSEPITEPTTEPTTDPITEPTTEPTTEPITEPTTESTSITTISTNPVFVEPSYPDKRIRGPTEPTTEPEPK